MVFSSSTFIFIFLPLAILGYYIIPEKYKNAFLSLISLLFYAWGEPKFVFIMIISILVNYIAALAIGRKNSKRKKTFFVIAIALNISLLFVFKYLNFVSSNLNRAFPGLSVTQIALPIGISFFTFQAISYIVDVYWGREKPETSIVNVCLYISFFPQLIAGPIVRYGTISKEIKKRNVNWNEFCAGIERFLIGLFKKLIIANNVSVIADVAFGEKAISMSIVLSWLGALAYAFQIYFDFSGYSDMAIGLGRMFGFHFNENFNYPYISSSVTEFWRRWHMSLGEWFRDYVYIPLGGSRCSRFRNALNLLIVWLLTGIWHGANWNFIIWGLIYFVVLVIEKFFVPTNESAKRSKIPRHAFTLLVVLIGWVIFRAETLSIGIEYLKSMFGLFGNTFIDEKAIYYCKEYAAFILVAGICSTPMVKLLFEKMKVWNTAVYNTVKALSFIFLFLVSISYPVLGSHNPFIYFNF